MVGVRTSEISHSWLILTLVGSVTVLAVHAIGARLWRGWSRSGDLLFSELMLWEWIRRVLADRQARSAARLIDAFPGHPATDRERSRRVRIMRRLATSLEARDSYTNRHSRRVARHAAMVAKRMKLSSQEVARVRTAAALHDIGKLYTPLAILNKPGALTEEENAAIYRHAVDGARMVEALGDPRIAEAVRHHHERLDGSGYPDQLAGEEIPLAARIIAVADTFDAITSRRPYREALPHSVALETLQREAGTHLDRDAVEAFASGYTRIGVAAALAAAMALPARAVQAIIGTPRATAAAGAGGEAGGAVAATGTTAGFASVTGLGGAALGKLGAIGATVALAGGGAAAIERGGADSDQGGANVPSAKPAVAASPTGSESRTSNRSRGDRSAQGNRSKGRRGARGNRTSRLARRRGEQQRRAARNRQANRSRGDRRSQRADRRRGGDRRKHKPGKRGRKPQNPPPSHPPPSPGLSVPKLPINPAPQSPAGSPPGGVSPPKIRPPGRGR